MSINSFIWMQYSHKMLHFRDDGWARAKNIFMLCSLIYELCSFMLEEHLFFNGWALAQECRNEATIIGGLISILSSSWWHNLGYDGDSLLKVPWISLSAIRYTMYVVLIRSKNPLKYRLILLYSSSAIGLRSKNNALLRAI